jgi:hypothetical protein
MAVADLYPYMGSPQIQAINTLFINAGQQTDRFSGVVGAIVAEFQNRIQRRGIPVSKTALSVPPELVKHVVWLILEAIQASLTGFEWTPLQVAQVKRAHEILDKEIQAGDFSITVPIDPAAGPTSTSGGGVTVVQAGFNRMTLRQMRGL